MKKSHLQNSANPSEFYVSLQMWQLYRELGDPRKSTIEWFEESILADKKLDAFRWLMPNKFIIWGKKLLRFRIKFEVLIIQERGPSRKN